MKWLYQDRIYDDRDITDEILCHPATVTMLDVVLDGVNFRRKCCAYCGRIQLDRSKPDCDSCGAPLLGIHGMDNNTADRWRTLLGV